jgi:hypothetical protein
MESSDGDQPGWRVGDRLVRLLDLDALLAVEPGGAGRASGVVSRG